MDESQEHPLVLAFCAYCGHTLENPADTDEENRRLFSEHILTCEKHPLAAAIRVNMVLRYAGGLLAQKYRESMNRVPPYMEPPTPEDVGRIELDRWRMEGGGPVAVTLADVERMLAVEEWDEKDDQFFSLLGDRWFRVNAEKDFEEAKKAISEKGFIKGEDPE